MGADWVSLSDATDPQRTASANIETLASAAEFVNTGDRSPNPSPPAPGTFPRPITSITMETRAPDSW